LAVKPHREDGSRAGGANGESSLELLSLGFVVAAKAHRDGSREDDDTTGRSSLEPVVVLEVVVAVMVADIVVLLMLLLAVASVAVMVADIVVLLVLLLVVVSPGLSLETFSLPNAHRGDALEPPSFLPPLLRRHRRSSPELLFPPGSITHVYTDMY
jgi:hypothetical protein